MTELCKSCARQNFCGNNITKYYCTGYMPCVGTRWEADDIKVPPFTDGQKKVIQATEKLANGKLICDVDDDIDVLTNEERMRTCSTEELATVIYGIAVYDTLYDRINNAFVLNPCEDDSAGINEVMKWLKEKHDGNRG